MRSLSNALRLLQLFSLERTTITLSYISDTLQISKSTACRLVQTLESEGFIIQDTKENVYRVGASIMAISNTILTQFTPFKPLASYVDELAAMTGQSVQLSILDGKYVLYVQKRQLFYDEEIRPQIGTRDPAHTTAAGQLLLSTLSSIEIEQLYNEDAISIKSLQEKLALYRRTQYVMNRDEYIPGVSALAVLIEGTAQRPLAALSIVSSTKHMQQYEKKWLHALKMTQKRIKEKNG